MELFATHIEEVVAVLLFELELKRVKFSVLLELQNIPMK